MKTTERGPAGIVRTLDDAIALHRQGRRSEAGAIYRELLRAEPDNPDVLHFSGLLAHQLCDDGTAVARMERALTLRPDYADAHKNLGNILLGLDRFAEAEQCYLRVIEIDPADAPAWSNLGIALRYQRRLPEAIEAGETAARTAPDLPVPWYNLGNSYKVDRQFNQAIRCYGRAIGLDPQFAAAHDGLCQCTLSLELRSPIGRLFLRKTNKAYEHWLACIPGAPVAAFMLQAIRGEQGLQRAPDEVIRGMFDQFAPSFEQRLAQLEYRVPQLVAEALGQRLGPPGASLEVLDGGCGTGLCGPTLRRYAQRLTGVDLSAGMLEHARKAGHYDQLAEAELTSYLQQHPGRFDLAVFADTLCYFGDLAPVAAAAATALRPGGWLLFTVEHLSRVSSGPGFRLHPHGRYSHTLEYVESVLTNAGLSEIDLDGRVLRLELGHDVAGLVVWARRPADA